MKKLLFLLFFTYTVNLSGQTINQWLQLTPIKIEKPVLRNTKDVNNKVFTNEMLLEYSGLNPENLVPDEGKAEKGFPHMQWTKAEFDGDTLRNVVDEKEIWLFYYATYLKNNEWLTGDLIFRLFGNAEIYIDGIKKATVTNDNPSNKTVKCEFAPGKHSIIVKTVSKGGKILTAHFKADKNFEKSEITVSTSPKRGKNIYDILNGKQFSQISVSPTGKYLLAEITESIQSKRSTTTYVYRVDNKEIVYSFGEVNNLKWVPGKDQLSFLQNEGEAQSLYAYDIEKKQLSCLIKADTKIKSYAWSPDYSYLIYTVTENFNDNNWELRKLAGIEDRQPRFRYRSYLCKYDMTTGLHSRLTWGNLSTSLMDISHSGNKLIFTTSFPAYDEFPYSKQSIYLMDMKTMKLDTLWKDRLYAVSCSFSPDDRRLLISGGPSAFGKLGENIGRNPIPNQYDRQLYIYNIDDKQVLPITNNFNPSIQQAVWHKDSHIYFTANDGDYLRLFRYANGSITPIKTSGDNILSISVSEKADRLMYLASEISYPARLYSFDLNNLEGEIWENLAQERYENIVFGETMDWDYQYKKGSLIDGRYYLPVDFDPIKKYPLIVYYYGGTTPVERTFGGRWPFNLYAALGYVVYVMQPSGAIGYGQEFSARHQNNWGKITADEIIASTKAFMKAHSFIDAKKVGCMGASYGGFTTMYLITQTDIFTCAISHAGISSISSYWGEGYWGYSYSTNATAHSFPWNRKDIYVDQSPLFNADKVHTPLLLIHGTKDVNVPTGESIQFYTALKLLGRDAELVFVKDADHAVVDYKQRVFWGNTILAYFAKYLKGQPAWWENLYPDKNL